MTLFDWVLVAGTAAILFELVSRFFFLRRILREAIRLFVWLELAAVMLLRQLQPPRYVLTGRCHRRGTCCTMIVGNPPRLVKNSPILLGLFAAFHRVVHNFAVVDRGDNDELIFSCGHLQSDGRCGIYRYRPFICRNYPVQYLTLPPQPLPGCGYGVAARVVTKMRPRPGLKILNPQVAVHHPTRPGGRHRGELPEDYRLVDLS